MCTAFVRQPAASGQQIRGHTAKRANLFAPLPRFDHTQAGDHKALMHIEPIAAGIEDFHRLGSFPDHRGTQAALEESEPGVWGESCSSACSKATRGGASRHQGTSFLTR